MRTYIFIALFLSSPSVFALTPKHLVDDVTGAQSWELKHDGVVFYLNQLLPDQLRAFYSNRGFSLVDIENYANACVFMTVLRNESAEGRIYYNSSEWSVNQKDVESPIKSVAAWLDDYQSKGVDKSALIAFRWAQFPIEQEYEPNGDWNQGMLALGARKGEFDVLARWRRDGKQIQLSLKGVSCAK